MPSARASASGRLRLERPPLGRLLLDRPAARPLPDGGLGGRVREVREGGVLPEASRAAESVPPHNGSIPLEALYEPATSC